MLNAIHISLEEFSRRPTELLAKSAHPFTELDALKPTDLCNVCRPGTVSGPTPSIE